MVAVRRGALGDQGSLSVRGGAESPVPWPTALGRAVRGAAPDAGGSRGGEERRCGRGPRLLAGSE